MAITLKEKLTIGSADKDGDVEVEMETFTGDTTFVFLSQPEVLQLIEFLQKQLRQP